MRHRNPTCGRLWPVRAILPGSGVFCPPSPGAAEARSGSWRPRLILLLAALLLGPWDTSRGDAAAIGPTEEEEPSAEVTLAGTGIDSTTIEVGVPTVVIYGLGYRDPVTGKWPRLKEARGVILAVNSKRLLLALTENGWSQRIDLARIQTLIMRRTSPSPPPSCPRNANPPRTATVLEAAPRMAPRDSIAATANRQQVTKYSQRPGWTHHTKMRLAVKYASGASVGTLSAVAGFLLFIRYIECADPEGGQEPILFCKDLVGLPVEAARVGHVVGTAFGVTLAEPYDEFTYLYALTGTWLGRRAARELVIKLPDREGWGWIALGSYIALPAVGAALASEGMRRFHEVPQFSVGLTLDRRGSLAGVATLRF